MAFFEFTARLGIVLRKKSVRDEFVDENLRETLDCIAPASTPVGIVNLGRVLRD